MIKGPDEKLSMGDAFCHPLIRQDDPIRKLRAICDEFLKRSDYAAMYSKVGRPAIEPEILAKALIWQRLRNLSDRQLEEAARFDLRVKFFLGLHVESDGFGWPHPPAGPGRGPTRRGRFWRQWRQVSGYPSPPTR